MKRQALIFVVTLAMLAGSLVAAGATWRDRDQALRGYVDATQDSDLPFRVPLLGVNAELTQYTPDQLTHQLDLMRQAHITWVRQFFRWDEIEPQAGVYQWDKWDAIVKPFASDPDLKLVAVLVDSPDWARQTNTQMTAPPTDPATFAAFAHDFAVRYGSTIDEYQIWDEPNLTAAWGNQPPHAVDYLSLLRAAYSAIHGADSSATVIAAGLAPTTEQGPDNISDITYLQDLYALGAAPYMDAVAAKPYGFNTSPDDRTIRDDTLNFSRMVALREVMVKNGDGGKALWASDWGWNSLPANWTGQPSIWGSVSSDEQTSDTLSALDRASREWPWVGGMILQEWQPDAAPTNPQWGFSIIDPQGKPTPLYSALVQRPQPTAATDGLYFPANNFARYSGVWTFGDLGADIGWVQDSQLDFSYQGSDVALLVRQDDYVAYLYATVDGQQANALPRDASGNALLNLTSDTRTPETNLVAVAHNLGSGQHTLHITADRGWDRWALAGFAVSSGNLADPYNRQIEVALLTAVISVCAAVVTAWRFNWQPVRRATTGLWQRLGDAGQIAISVITSLALMIGMLLTWSDFVPSLFRQEPVQIGLAMLTAGLIYVQPHLLILIAALLLLFVIIYHRLDLGLMLTVFYTPFFLFPVDLYKFAFPMSELVVLITAVAWLLRSLADWGRARRVQKTISFSIHLSPLDGGVLALVVLGALSLIWAAQRGAAITELRTLLIEPALFYLILRTTARDQKTLLRLVDALLIAGLLVAVIGLYQFVHGQAIIMAEGGAERLASVYGSPNNVGLFLGRCIPFLLAFTLIRVDRLRRVLAGISLIIVLIAAVLTQSAGALLLGIPFSVAAVLLLVYGKRGLIAIVGLAAVGAAGFVVALRSQRFARLLSLTNGTDFLRIRVWQSALEMIHDHPITGLGLDQFLYAYRGQYIMPDAFEDPNLSHPHNFLLDFWIRLGIFGVITFFWIQGWFWKRAWMLYRSLRDPLAFALIVGVIGCMVNLLAHGLVDNSVFVNDLVYVFMLLIGLVSNLPHESDDENIRAIDVKAETMM